MNDSDKIRSVVARFFGVAESTVTDAFVFPRDRLQGSVGRTTLHAALKRMAGADLSSAFSANTYGELLGTAAVANHGGKAPIEAARASTIDPDAALRESDGAPSSTTSPIGVGLGIDIESAENLPWSGDPRSEPFYLENFTGAEIAYCVRQGDPRLSFCGLWCAKEAAIKGGLGFAGVRPSEIEIHHGEDGRPMLRKAGATHPTSDCQVSISHAGRTCVAVCLQAPPAKAASPAREATPALLSASGASGQSRGSFERPLVWLSLGLSLLAVLLWLSNWIRH